jgi:exonuclease III
MGDFNAVADFRLNRSNSTHNFNRYTESVLNIMKQKGFLDAYHECNPNNRSYTWAHNGNFTQTRIDYIWLSPNWNNYLLHSNIISADLVINSNHKIVTCLLCTHNIIRNYNVSQNYQNSNKQIIFKYKKMTDEL